MSITDSIKEMFSGEPSVASLQDLFLEQLKDMYDAENRILDALPTMAEKATSAKLTAAFEKHREQTAVHVERLENVFDLMGEDAEGQTCEAIKGLIEEAEEVMGETEGAVLDAGLVASAQAVEHYEIGRYGTLKSWAETLGMTEAAKLFDQTLREEVQTDELLSKLGEGGINASAAGLRASRSGTTAHASRAKHH